MEDTLKVIYVAADLEQAHLLKNILRDAGIQAYVSNKASLQFAVGDLPMGWSTAARVVVHDYDAQDARRIALEFDEAGQDAGLEDDLEEFELDQDDAPWPCCPSCGRPRHTSCPVCETAGTDFPRAFQPDDEQLGAPHVADGRQNLLVLCPSCDEPFTPQFPARCEWCGHRFGDGWEPPPITPAEPSELTARVWIVMAGLLITIAATIAFFAAIAAER
jgi:hypothetical protein